MLFVRFMLCLFTSTTRSIMSAEMNESLFCIRLCNFPDEIVFKVKINDVFSVDDSFSVRVLEMIL